MNIKYSLLFVLILFIVAPLAAAASNGWQVTVGASRLPKYLDYPASSLKSIIKLSVAYRQDYDVDGAKMYETLYYNASLPIGCVKHGPLSLPLGGGGVIRVNSSSDDAMPPEECDAVANASGRLFLDLYLKKYLVSDIVVPAASFDGIIDAFKRSGFYESDPSNSAKLVLSIVSDPPGRCQPVSF